MNLDDEITIEENQEKNIKLELKDNIDLTDNLDSVYKIIRKGDTAFLRSDIY
jgi:hypothetical protein